MPRSRERYLWMAPYSYDQLESVWKFEREMKSSEVTQNLAFKPFSVFTILHTIIIWHHLNDFHIWVEQAEG